MESESRLKEMLLRRSQTAEKSRQEAEERQRLEARKAAETARILSQWRNRAAELQVAVGELNEKIASNGMKLTMNQFEAKESYAKAIAGAGVAHEQHTLHVHPRWSLSASVDREGRVRAIVGSMEGMKRPVVDFDVSEPSAARWMELLLDYLDATIIAPNE